jgi:hypothetical protein
LNGEWKAPALQRVSELWGKRVEVLKELLPAIARLGILGNSVPQRHKERRVA